MDVLKSESTTLAAMWDRDRGPAPVVPMPLAGNGPAVTPEGLVLRKVASDQVFDTLAQTAGSRSTMDVITRGQQTRRDERKLKQGHGKTMHRANSRIAKSHRDMVRSIRDVRMGALKGQTNPGFVKKAIHRMVLTTTGYTSMLTPLVDLMGEMHASNRRIRISQDAERALVGNELGRRGPGKDQEDLESAFYLSQADVRHDMEEGRFQLAWSRDTMGHALKLVDESVDALRDAIDGLKRRLTPKEQNYQQKQLARLERRHEGFLDERPDVPDGAPVDPKTVNVDSELVALASLDKERQVLGASFREVLGMESCVV
ncbi:MAG: hypothetical protein AB1758_18180 [Candidatus Eremiobacterota bacterium]